MMNELRIELKAAINHYCEEYTSAEKIFSATPINEIIQLADSVLGVHRDIPSKDIWDFVEGLYLFPFSVENKEDRKLNEDVSNLLKPLASLIFNYLKSNDYPDFVVAETVDDDELLEVDDLWIPITKKKILRFIKMNDRFILTQKGVQDAVDDFIKLQRSKDTPQPMLTSIEKLPSDKFNSKQLEKIFIRLCSRKIVRSNDQDKFISFFTETPLGKIYWNDKIRGAKSGLFDLMERITGKKFSASLLKKYFDTSSIIHDNWRIKLGKQTKLIDLVVHGL